MSVAAQPPPWSRSQVGLVVAADALALVAIAMAWHASGSTAILSKQIGWLNLAAAGLVLALGAHGALFFFGRRALGRLCVRVVADIQATSLTPILRASSDQWWWTPGTRRVHRAGCLFLAGRDARSVGPAQVSDLERCELCD